MRKLGEPLGKYSSYYQQSDPLLPALRGTSSVYDKSKTIVEKLPHSIGKEPRKLKIRYYFRMRVNIGSPDWIGLKNKDNGHKGR